MKSRDNTYIIKGVKIYDSIVDFVIVKVRGIANLYFLNKEALAFLSLNN